MKSRYRIVGSDYDHRYLIDISGNTTLCKQLEDEFHFEVCSGHEYHGSSVTAEYYICGNYQKDSMTSTLKNSCADEIILQGVRVISKLYSLLLEIGGNSLNGQEHVIQAAKHIISADVIFYNPFAVFSDIIYKTDAGQYIHVHLTGKYENIYTDHPRTNIVELINIDD